MAISNHGHNGGPPARQALHPVLQEIVQDALALGPGATLPTNAYYQRNLQTGASTLQRALGLLADYGALTVTSRGHLGRVIRTLDVGQAWQAAGLAPIRLILPPSGPVEIDVLQTAITNQLTEHGIPHTIHHERGGARRISKIENGQHDLAVVSAGVAHSDRTSQEHLLIRDLSPGTYYAPGQLAAVHRQGTLLRDQTNLRVAIDCASPDHIALTEAEFPDTQAFISCPFPQVPPAVLRDHIDVGIWHITRTLIPLDLAGLMTTPLQQAATHRAWEKLSPASLVGWTGRPELASILNFLQLDSINEQQREILAEEREGAVK